MRKLDLGNRVLTEKDVFVIAEIGSNHMGDADLCEKLIIAAARCGADAVKLQKRDNKVMFTKTALARPYDNELSYGATYGEHREHLDWFGLKEFERFKAAAEKAGVVFFATPFEEESALFLHRLGVTLWKIASCDVTNLPLVQFVASFQQPMILSTGGAAMWDILRLTDTIDSVNRNYALLHCISTYPNTDESLNLGVIGRLREMFPENLAGFSSHHPGLLPCIIARGLGASIFEVHFTLNRGWRGTDHGFSMEPKALGTLCEDLRRVKTMIGDGNKVVTEEERSGFVSKMGKGIYLNRPMKAGEVIRDVNIVIKAPAAGGCKPFEVDDVVGRELLADCATGVNLRKEWLK